MFKFFKKIFKKVPIEKPTIYKFQLPEKSSEETKLSDWELIDQKIYKKICKILTKYPPHEWFPDKHSTGYKHPTCKIHLSVSQNNNHNIIMWLADVRPTSEILPSRLYRDFKAEQKSFEEKEFKEKAEKIVDEFLSDDNVNLV